MESSFLSLFSSATDISTRAASVTLLPTNATKKRLRSIDASAGSDAAQLPHDPVLRAITPASGSSDSSTARASPSHIRGAAIAGPRAASSSSLSCLTGTSSGSSEKDNNDLQRLLDSDEAGDEEAEEADEDGDGESDEKSPVTSPYLVLTPLSSMAAAAAASQYNSSPSPLTSPVQSIVAPTPLIQTLIGDGSGGGGSGGDNSSGGTEFISQLFVIYMPKINFKRFIVSSLNTMIIRASKTEKAMPRANHPPMSARPPPIGSSTSTATNRPPIPPLSTSHSSSATAGSAVASGPISPSAAKKPLPSASFSSSSSVSGQDSHTHHVAMEDVIACLQAHGVKYNKLFMWMDLSDFGQRFVQQMLDSSKTIADGTLSPTPDAQPANDTYGGLWYNVAHKSHLVVNYFSHPFLGEGYAVVITLDLLDGNKDLAVLSQAAMAERQTQTVTISNDALYKATRNINEGGITSHPAILTAASTTTVSSTTFTPFPLPSFALSADPPGCNNQRRKARPVESIGEMLDRIAKYQRIRLQVKSKNKACERLGCSKGTINVYREKVKQALQLGVDLNQVRQTKFRDLKRLLEAVQSGNGVGGVGISGRGSPGGGSRTSEKVSGSSGGSASVEKKEDELKWKSNNFGDLGMALMAKQDAGNGGRKAKAEVEADGKQSDDDDSEICDSAGDNNSGGSEQPSSRRQRKQLSPGKVQEVGIGGSSVLPLSINSISVTSSPRQPIHRLQSLLSTGVYSAAQPHSQLTYLALAPQHSTFTATPLPACTTYVLSQPQGPQLPGGYSSGAFGQYGGPAQCDGGGALYAQSGGAGQFQPGSVVHAANGATYQITGPMTQVQMANVCVQQSLSTQQTAFTKFI